ncbi:hypothetical protein NG796_03220 [Laspinema sp. A4]|uniref:hypothetical protein n=1 Tax=Laspinema sp. D2d TaxID=2953686 RepID=UPI0021BA59BD|nr:hypothetical protein [Laspinema sp. D2d]MCT7982299.1 hypothetical protein [Laspinema sp. D2d]
MRVRDDVTEIEALYLELGETQSIVYPPVCFEAGELGMPHDRAIAHFYRELCHVLFLKLIFSIPCVKISAF